MKEQNDPRKYEVWDYGNKERRTMHELLIAEEVRSGRVGLLQDKDYPVLDDEGNSGTIKGRDAHAAFTGGYTIDPFDNREERRKTDEYESLTGQAKAAALGTARGVTFGLSDQGLVHSGMMDAETLRELEDRNPNLSMAGEIAGTLGGLLVPGGAIAKGAAVTGKAGLKLGAAAAAREFAKKGIQKRLLSAPRVVGDIGEFAGKVIAKDGSHWARKLAGKAVGSGIEGAFYGAGHAVSEDALGRADFTAEVIPAAAQGFAFGAAAPLLFKGVETVGRPTLNFAKSKADAALDIVSNNLGKGYAKLTSALSGVEESTAKKLFSKPFREEGRKIRQQSLRSSDDILSDSEKLTKNLNDFETSLDEYFKKTFKDKIRGAEIKKLGDHELPQDDYWTLLRLLKGADDSVGTMLADEPIHNPSLLKQYQKIIHNAKTKFLELKPEAGAVDTKASQYFNLIDDTKGRLQELARYDKAISADPATKTSAKVIRNTASEFRKHLEDWEGALGQRQKDFNESVTSYLESQKTFRKLFTDKKVVRGQDVHTISPTKVNTYLNQQGKLSGVTRENALEDYFSKVFKYMNETKKTWMGGLDDLHLIKEKDFLPNITKENFRKLEINKEGMLENLKWTKELSKLKDQMFDQGVGLSEIGLAGSVGGMVGGAGITAPLVGGASLLYGVAKNPYNSMKILSALERMQNHTIKSINKAAKNIVSVTPSISKGVPASYNALINADLFGTRKETPKDKRAAYHYLANDLNDMAANPVAFMDKLDEETDMLSGFAPETADQIRLQKINAFNFLHQKMPKAESINILDTEEDYIPSDIEMSKFERYVAAVNDPLSVMTDLEKGYYSKEGAEVVKSLYPSLYELMVGDILEEISKKKDRMAYTTKIQLSQFLGMDFTGNLNPIKINIFQGSFGQQEEQGSSANKPISISTQTNMERIES